MVQLVCMLVSAIAISMAVGAAHANMTIQTFPVPAGAGPHDVYPAQRGRSGSRRNPLASWVGSIQGPVNQI